MGGVTEFHRTKEGEFLEKRERWKRGKGGKQCAAYHRSAAEIKEEKRKEAPPAGE